jgi:2OG-Fe(II) oxygenase superfamily
VSVQAMLPYPNVALERLVTHPWPHIVLDGFLPDDILVQSLAEIGRNTYTFDLESRGTGRIEFSLLQSETLWRAIYSRKTVALLSSAFEVDVKLNRDNMVQLRRMNDETPAFPMHSDFTSSQASIASFLYLSPGWLRSCGGRLHLFHSESDGAPSASIEPLQNRFVAFRTEPAHWHSVEKVSGWQRLSALALWNIQDRSKN